MIMKLSNHTNFMCPQSAAREKPFSCKGLKCPWYSIWGHGHYRVMNKETVVEKMFFCAGADCPSDLDEELQYPHHKKEKEEWRKFSLTQDAERRRKDLKSKEALQEII